jgi:uncharacterized protein YkwD
VAIARRATNVLRHHLLHAIVCVALLALCVACCAVASTAPASTLARTLRANSDSSYTSAPAKPLPGHRRSSCARPSSFQTTSPPAPGAPQHGKRRSQCHRRHQAKRHHRGARRHAPQRSGACSDARLRPTTANLPQIDAATLCLVNRERTSRGEAALRSNGDLQASAQRHSSEMSAGDYFEHDGPGGSTPLSRMRAAGYIFSSRIGYAVGENIAWGTLWLATPKAIVAGWMASPGHRANILDATFKDTGVGVSPHPVASLANGQAGAIYTQDFGRIMR